MEELKIILHIAWKDVVCEYRNRQTFSSVLFFALLVIVIFNFAFDPGSAAIAESAGAILWVAFTFAGVISLNRSFAQEQEEAALQGLLMSPADRGVIYLGKFASNLIFLVVLEALIFPVFCVFFNLAPWQRWLWLSMIFILTDIGFVAVGTLFSAMANALRTREIMLPVLLFPIIVPIIIASVRATETLLDPRQAADVVRWLKLLVAFDLVYVALGTVVFQFVVEE